jgi:hypothetical protein
VIEANLERQRWLPRELPADRVWVNVPDQQLVLFRDDRPVFVTRVVVGDTTDRKQSPEFHTIIESTLFNPPWIIPSDIVEADIRMNYIAPYAEYSFYQKGPWEVSVPIQMGVGKSFLCYKQAGEHIVTNRNSVVIYEPGMTFEYKILKLIGVGAGFGYRIMLRNNRTIDQQFTSPVYALRLRLIFDELHGRYKRHFSPEKPISD